MQSLKSDARLIGFLYFVFSVIAVVNEFILSAGFVVRGDPAATASNILADTLRFRAGIALGIIDSTLFIAIIVLLYHLFREVSTKLGLMMILLVVMGLICSYISMVLKSAPLVLLTGEEYRTAFTQQQLEALSYGLMKIRGTGNHLATAFWGLWLFPFGTLVIKSRFIPKLFGILLIIAGVGYLVTSVVGLLTPEYSETISRWMMPLYFGELPIVFWLMIKGVKNTPQVQ